MTRRYTTNIIELKKRMIECNINTIKELSKVSGVNRTTLGKILKGTIQPTTYVIDKLMTALDISQNEAGPIFFSTNLRNE